MSTKIEEAKRLTDSVVDIMRGNLEKVMQREERLESLSDSTAALSLEAGAFQRRSRELRRQHCWKNWKLTLIITGVCLVIVAIIVVIIVSSTKH